MKVIQEMSLNDFEFWSGARDTVEQLTEDEIDQIESILEDQCPDGLSETEINDIFWFEDDMIADWLGYESFEQLMERNCDHSEADYDDE